jgi:hypothetical protein
MTVFIDGGWAIGSRHAVLVSASVPNLTMVAEFLEDARRTLIGDPFRGQLGAVKALEQRPFSYREDHDTVRKDVLAAIQDLPFSADACFVSVDKRTGAPVGGKTGRFVCLARLMARWRRQSADVVISTRIHEDQSTVDKYVRLVSETPLPRSVKPSGTPTIRKSSDADVCLALPDYVAGVVRDLLTNLEDGDEGETRNVLQRYALVSQHLDHVTDETRGISYRDGAFAAEIKRRALRS